MSIRINGIFAVFFTGGAARSLAAPETERYGAKRPGTCKAKAETCFVAVIFSVKCNGTVDDGRAWRRAPGRSQARCNSPKPLRDWCGVSKRPHARTKHTQALAGTGTASRSTASQHSQGPRYARGATGRGRGGTGQRRAITPGCALAVALPGVICDGIGCLPQALTAICRRAGAQNARRGLRLPARRRPALSGSCRSSGGSQSRYWC